MAMESKGFDGDDDRTCYQIIKKGPVDVVFAIVTIGYVLSGMIFFSVLMKGSHLNLKIFF